MGLKVFTTICITSPIPDNTGLSVGGWMEGWVDMDRGNLLRFQSIQKKKYFRPYKGNQT